MIRRLRSGALAVSALALAACVTARAPTFPPAAAADIGPKLNNYGQAVLPRGGLIVVEGDAVAYGLAPRSGPPGAPPRRSPATIAETLKKVLKDVTVETRAEPDRTLGEGVARSAGRPPANLLILSYATGDAAAHTSADAYAAALRKRIAQAHEKGAAVFLLTAPPVKDATLNVALEPYRVLMRQVGAEMGAEVFDAATVMARIGAKPAGVALSARAYRAIAGEMVPYIAIAPSPQTGQAGSGGRRTVRASAESAS